MTEIDDQRREIIMEDVIHRIVVGNELHPFPLTDNALRELLSSFLATNLGLIFSIIEEMAIEVKEAQSGGEDVDFAITLDGLRVIFRAARESVEKVNYIENEFIEDAKETITLVHSEKHLKASVRELTEEMGLSPSPITAISELLESLSKIGAKVVLAHQRPETSSR